MKIHQTSYSIQPGASTIPDIYCEAGALQVFLSHSADPFSGSISMSGRVVIAHGGNTLVDIELSGTYSLNTSTLIITTTHAATYHTAVVPTTDTPVSLSYLPVTQGTNPPNGTNYFSAQGSFNVLATPTQVFIPKGATLTFTGAASQGGNPVSIGGGFLPILKPGGSFTVENESGGSVGFPNGTLGTNDESANFDATASVPAASHSAPGFYTPITDPATSIVSYEWDFGDGNTGTGATITHTYIDVGPTAHPTNTELTGHPVTLVVTDNYGGKYSVTTTVFHGAQQEVTVGSITDPLGFLYLAAPDATTTPKSLALKRHNGSTLSTLSSLSDVSGGALAVYQADLLLLAQAATAKTWTLRRSRDSGSTWTTMSSPFDNTHKGGALATNQAGAIFAAAIDASLNAQVKVSRDGGDTWSSAVNAGAIGSGAKSLSLHTQEIAGRARLILSNGNSLSRYSDNDGATWSTL